MCDEKIYNSIPTKKQIKVELAGILIVNVVSGKLPETKKKGMFAKAKDKAEATLKSNSTESKKDKKNKK